MTQSDVLQALHKIAYMPSCTVKSKARSTKMRHVCDHLNYSIQCTSTLVQIKSVQCNCGLKHITHYDKPEPAKKDTPASQMSCLKCDQ